MKYCSEELSLHLQEMEPRSERHLAETGALISDFFIKSTTFRHLKREAGGGETVVLTGDEERLKRTSPLPVLHSPGLTSPATVY